MLNAFSPVHPLLQRYIHCYYFSPSHSGPISYIAFPHVNTCLSFFYNTSLTIHADEITIAPAENTGISACATGIYTTPVYVQYTARIKEIAIIFKPLGINHFIDLATDHLHSGAGRPFTQLPWLQFAEKLMYETDEKETIRQLELFLIAMYKDKELDIMYAAMALLNNDSEHYSIDAIARQLHMHRKTLERHFTAAFGCTPNTYRRITRFRKSVDMHLLSSEIHRLTKVAYDAHYYDQSYFVREFRKLTRSNPKNFFSKIATYEQNKIVWMPR